MTIEKNAELIDTVPDFIFLQNMKLVLYLACCTEKLMQGKNRVVGRVIGIVAGRPVGDLPAVLQRKEICNRNGLVVGHKETELRPGCRAPCAHPRVGPRLLEIDRRIAALLVALGVCRFPLLVRTPAKLGGLEAFGQKAFDGPGVPEHVRRLRLLGPLRIALGNVDALDADLLHQLRPTLAVGWLLELDAGFSGHVDKRFLDEPGNHARICAAAGDSRRAARFLLLFLADGFAQCVVRAIGGRSIFIKVEAEPRLDDGVDVEDTEFPAQFHEIKRRGVDRQVHNEALPLPLGDQRRQDVLEVVRCQSNFMEFVAPIRHQFGIRVDRINHRKA